MRKLPTFKNKTKVVYNTTPKQFWCMKCGCATNVKYFDGDKHYCDKCFEGEESDYEVIVEYEKGGWIK